MAIESRSNFTAGQKDVSSAGTPEQLPRLDVGEACDLVVKAKASNTGAISVGHDSDTAQNAPFTLEPGEHMKLRIADSTKVWVDAENDGDGVEYVAET